MVTKQGWYRVKFSSNKVIGFKSRLLHLLQPLSAVVVVVQDLADSKDSAWALKVRKEAEMEIVRDSFRQLITGGDQ